MGFRTSRAWWIDTGGCGHSRNGNIVVLSSVSNACFLFLGLLQGAFLPRVPLLFGLLLVKGV